MNIIIGCSGSTGSSLLKTILNRHSQILAGPETCLFAFPQVYDNWEKYQPTLLTKITTDGWVIRKGMDLLQPAYGWTQEALINTISNAPSFKSFVDAFFNTPLVANNKKYWIEKTPVNAYGFRSFLQVYATGKTIQIVRDPYDTVTSLMARGMNPYYAAGYYIYNTAIASSSNTNDRYYQLKYEDLVASPKTTLEKLFHFLEIPFEENIITAKHEQRKEPTTMAGWKHHETAAVQASSIGRFKELPTTQQLLIQTALHTFKIHPAYAEKYHIKYTTCQELCEVLGYDFLADVDKQHLATLKKYYWKSRAGRVRHQGWQAVHSFPGDWVV